MLMGLPYRDTQCGAKVLRRAVVRDVLPRLASHDLLFDVDLLAAAREGGWRVVEVPTVWIDQEGSRVSTVSDSRRMPPRGASRRCSSGRSRAGRTAMTRCSAAARTWSSAVRRSTTSAASRSSR
jgi:hypothetical protein